MPEYYIAPWGDDMDLGTKTKPWRTIQKGCDIAQPGDFVIVLEGDYLSDGRVQINGSGVDGMMITFQTEGQVLMRGFTIKADWITVRGFEIPETTPDENNWQDGHGIFVRGNYCVIENNYISFSTWPGINLHARPGQPTETSYCIVRNNRINRCFSAGILVYGRNHLIEENEVWETIQHHPRWTAVPAWADADGMHFHGSGHIFRKNYIHDISLDQPENVDPHIDCFQTFANAGAERADNVIFEKNRCENLNAGMYVFMLKDATNLIIRNNVFLAFGGINTDPGSNDTLVIVNNLFANSLILPWGADISSGIILGNCPNSIVKNNIFYDQPNHTISATGDVNGHEVDYNLAFRSDGQPSWPYKIDYTNVDPPPPNHIWDVDPLFVNPSSLDFRIRSGSPARDVGVVLIEVTDDYYGAERPQGTTYDIGISEYRDNPAQSVDEINIANWQGTGQKVQIDQYDFDLNIKWTDQFGVHKEHGGTYLYPNDLSGMPNSVRKSYAEEMVIAAARVALGIDSWEDYK